MSVTFKSNKVHSKCTTLMQGLQNATENHVYCNRVNKHNMAILTANNFFAQCINYIPLVEQLQTNRK